MAKDNESQPISEESLDEIKRNALKGKTRKFVMVVKGGAIQTLIVFKKGAFAPKIGAAKKEGFSGEATCGLISGQGTQAVLQLAGNKEVAAALGLSDGDVCEKEPCKAEKLRQFLKETGDLKVQASFEIVQQATAVKGVSEQDESEGDEDETPPVPPPTSRGQVESEADEDEADDVQAPPKAPPTLDDATKQKLVETLKKLAPAVQQAIVAQPSRKDELFGQLNAAKEAIAAGRLADATAAIKQLGALLQAQGGPKPGGGGTFDAKQWAAAKTQWQDAIETVDRQISALQKELLKTGDGDLKEIAEFGLNGVTGNLKVPLMSAMREVDGAAPADRSKAAAQAVAAARKFEDHINRDARVRACDAYATEVFQVDLAIADTLGPALEKICEVLEPATSA